MNKVAALFSTALIFSLWLVLFCLLWKQPVLLTSILIVLAAVYFLFYRRGDDLMWFVGAAILGPIGEAVVSASGLWTYHGQTIFGVPYWLPLAWGLTTVVFRKILALLNRVNK